MLVIIFLLVFKYILRDIYTQNKYKFIDDLHKLICISSIIKLYFCRPVFLTNFLPKLNFINNLHINLCRSSMNLYLFCVYISLKIYLKTNKKIITSIKPISKKYGVKNISFILYNAPFSSSDVKPKPTPGNCSHKLTLILPFPPKFKNIPSSLISPST